MHNRNKPDFCRKQVGMNVQRKEERKERKKEGGIDGMTDRWCKWIAKDRWIANEQIDRCTHTQATQKTAKQVLYYVCVCWQKLC